VNEQVVVAAPAGDADGGVACQLFGGGVPVEDGSIIVDDVYAFEHLVKDFGADAQVHCVLLPEMRAGLKAAHVFVRLDYISPEPFFLLY
jgi:hypothetical protein